MFRRFYNKELKIGNYLFHIELIVTEINEWNENKLIKRDLKESLTIRYFKNKYQNWIIYEKIEESFGADFSIYAHDDKLKEIIKPLLRNIRINEILN